jgi:hypothetical protein
MLPYRPPSLDKAAPIVDPATGRITPYFQRFWQNLSFTAGDAASASSDVGNKVDKGVSAGWVAATGTATKTTFSTYTAPTISASPTQGEVQAIASALQTTSQHLKAVIDALLASGLLTA